MPAPPAAYATQSRVRGMRGLQGVRGALHGSPGLFCLDRAAHFSQAGLGSSECARLLRYHYDGAGVTPLWQGWGQAGEVPHAHHGTLTVRRQTPARLCTLLEMRPLSSENKAARGLAACAPRAQAGSSRHSASASCRKVNQPRCSATHSHLHKSAGARARLFPSLEGPLHTKIASYATRGTTLGSLIGS